MRPPITAQRAVAVPIVGPDLSNPTTGTTLVGDAFSESSTTPNQWFASSNLTGDGCLTAGTASTPGTSLPACGSNAPQDADGQGALQTTLPANGSISMVVNKTPISTKNGLQITFTDYSFNGTNPGADGSAVFLTDASQPLPPMYGGSGGGLGFSNVNGSSGVANGYLIVGLDEWGNFSAPSASDGGTGAAGGPGPIAETLAVRGAAPSSTCSSCNYAYLGGAVDAQGNAASLPFTWDQQSTTRPATAPTIRVTLSPAGFLTAAVDIHNGKGFVVYYAKYVVGANSYTSIVQPAVPANVYVGLSAATGGAYTQKQVASFNVSTLTPVGTFTPKKIPDLAAWYDASQSSNVVQSGGKVSAWLDSSGAGNTLGQASSTAQPTYSASAYNGHGGIVFNGTNAYLTSSNAAFSKDLFNASTVFVVSAAASQSSLRALMWSGNLNSNPRWRLQTDNNEMSFQFNSSSALLIGHVAAAGGAIWSAGGSSSLKLQYLRKNGNLLATGEAASGATGNYPLSVGAIGASGTAQYPFDGTLAEVVVYRRYLSPIELQYVEGYLACKWHLQDRLPANHPFRHVCPENPPAGSPYPTPAPLAGGLQNPPDLFSQNGTLIFNVTAQQNATTSAPELVYNGSATPPTLRLIPGDTLLVNLTNNLPAPPNSVNYTNATNLHFHGLHVSPNAPGDDSIDMLASPGQVLHYRVTIPSNAPPGLFWYHSHAHGEADRQNLAGMSGALIVDGMGAYAPAVMSLPERVLVVRDAEPPGQSLPDANPAEMAAMRWGAQYRAALSSSFGPTTNEQTHNPNVLIDPHYRTFVRPAADTHCTSQETPVKVWTVNGMTNPKIGIRPGELQFWRVVNAGSDTYLDLQVDGAQLQIVAVDGAPLTLGVNMPAETTLSHWVLPPASRVEFILKGPPAGTPAYVRTNCFDDGSSGPAMPAAILATIDPDNSSTDAVVRRVQYAKPAPLHDAHYVKAHQVARTQTIYYSDQNTINGVAYDPSAAPAFYAQSGTVEEWTIVNNSSQGHTFHIHQIHFLVEAINGVTQSQEFMMDNVNVPAATAAGPGTVKILLDFTDPLLIGTFLLHCHILSHEDGGMMAKIRVGTAAPLVLSSGSVTFKSASAAPQTVTVSGGQAPYVISGCAGIVNASISGAKITMVPSAAGSCVLNVTDSTQLTGNISVTVDAAAPVVTLSQSSVSFVSPSAPAQSVTIAGGTPPYDAAGCTGTATAAISSDTLKVTPQTAGSCTITVSDTKSNTNNLAVSVNIPQSGFPQDNLTFHHDPARSGWYSSETALTTSTVASSTFKLQATLAAPSGMPAFGKVYAQPLYASQETVTDGTTHNLVIVATSTDQVYAFDDQTRTVIWHRDFTDASAGIRQQLWTDTGCSDVNPNVGITGTPVIDRTLDRLYVVVPTSENGTFHLRIHALSLKSGLEAQTSNGTQIGPTEVTGSVNANGGVASVDPLNNYNRGALLEANGNVYVALGSHCDYQASTTHGWVLSYDASTLAVTANIINITNDNTSGFYLGSPWMSGYGPAADAQGNIYFATGNGPTNGTTDFAMSILQVPGNLDMTSTVQNKTWFAPAGAAGDSGADQDLGSGGVVLLPDQPGSVPHLLAQGGKCGVGSSNGGTNGCQLWILNRDSMGGQQTGDAGAAFHIDTGCGMWGGPASFADASSNEYLVYGCGSPLSVYKVLNSPVSLSVASSSNVGQLEGRDAGSQPVVSSNGTTAGSAVVWALQTPGNNGGSITLVAMDALNMTHSAGNCASGGTPCLFQGVAGSWTWDQSNGSAWIGGALVSPLVANGNVYVPVDGGVAVFGLH